MSPLSPSLCPIIVGRDAGLARSAGLLSAASEGAGALLFISGEAGIGKSRFARALMETARWRGFSLLIGACQEHDRDFPYAPLLDALRHLLHHGGADDLAALLRAEGGAIARLLPELDAAHAAPPMLPPEHEKRRIFEAFVHLFNRFAACRPLVVVVEDVHWADATSLELLHLLARRLQTARVLFVVTARSDEPGSGLDHWLGSLQRNRLVTEERLTPLTEPEVARMIGAILDTPLAVPVMAAINQRAEGNPFFIEELLHALTGEREPGGWGGWKAATSRYIPIAVAETVRRRLDTLDAWTQDVAALASVVGRRFSFDLLRTLTDFDEIMLTEALRQLIAARLVIEEDADDAHLFAFRHALTRDAIYGRLLGPELRRLHHRVMRAFAMEPSGWSRPADGVLGYHSFMAEEWERAREQCQRAGEQALALARKSGWRKGESWSLSCLAFCVAAQGDYARAFPWAEQARQIADEIEDRGVQFVAEGALGISYLELYAVPMALHHLTRALMRAREVGSTHYIENVVGFMVTAHLANNDMARADALLRESLSPDTPMRTFGQRRIWLARAELALAHGDPRLALRIADELIASAPNRETLGDRGIPRIDLLRGDAFVALGRYADAEQTLRTAARTARAQDARPLLWRIHRASGHLYHKMQRHTDATREFGAALRIVETLAATVPDEHTRGTFLRQAHASIPRAYLLASRRTAKQRFGGLTAREREVVAMIADGKTNRGIADGLFVTEKTVELHITNSLRKLGFRGRVELAAWAVESGLAQSQATPPERAAPL